MARKPRIVVAGQPLHVIQRGNDRQAVFYADEDYQHYLDDLNTASQQHGCQIHAYVLMTNHVHLLITPTAEDSASRMMQTLGRRYVRYINTEYRRTGTLWEGRFKSALIDSEQYLLTCSRYIELNPVRANLVATPEQYRWSSFAHNALGRKDNLIQCHEVYRQLGMNDATRCSAYRPLFDAHIGLTQINQIRRGTETNDLVGSDKFRQEIEMMLNRKLSKCKHGGDRKSKSFISDGKLHREPMAHLKEISRVT